MQKPLFVIGNLLGIAIAYVDSRPGWDDTGITAGAVFIASGILGALGPERPWLWALCVGAWIPLFEILHGWNWGSLLALGIALVGAYGGMLVRVASGRRAGS